MSSTKKPTVLKFRLLPKTLKDLEANPDHDRNAKDFLPMNRAAEKHLTQMMREERNRLKAEAAASSYLNDSLHAFPSAPAITHIPGEAAKYGVFFDDREYNYLQHIKPLGQAPGSVFIPATPKDDSAAGTAFNNKAADSEDDSETRRKKIIFEQEKAAKEASEDYKYQRSLIADNEGAIEAFKALDDDAYVVDEDDDFFGDDLVFKMKGCCDVDGEDGHDGCGSDSGSDTDIYEEYYEEEDGDFSGNDSEFSINQTEPERSTIAPSVAMTTLSKMESKFEQLLLDEYDGEDGAAFNYSSDDGGDDELWDRWNAADGNDDDDSDDSFDSECDDHRDDDRDYVVDANRFNDDIPILADILDDFIEDQHDHLTAKDPEDRKRHCIRWLDQVRKELRPVAQSTIDRLIAADDDDSSIPSENEGDDEQPMMMKRDMPNINTFRDEEVPTNLPLILTNRNTKNKRNDTKSAVSLQNKEAPKTRIIISKRGLPVVVNVADDDELNDDDDDNDGNDKEHISKENQGKARQKGESKEDKKARKAMAKGVRKAALAKKNKST